MTARAKAMDGDGSIRKRRLGDGSYVYDVQVTLKNPGPGERKRTTRTFRTQKEAGEYKRAANLPGKVPPSTRDKAVMVPQVIERWLTEGRGKKKESTMRTYWSSYHLNVPTKLNIRVDDLTETRVRQFVRDVGKASTHGNGRESARTAFNNLKTAMRWAAHPDRGPIIKKDPMAGMLFEYSVKGKKRRAMPLEDYHAILDACAGKPSQLIWRILIETGARRGEILGLNVGDVDFRRGTINIWKISSPESEGKYVREGTKADDDRPPIPLGKDLLEDLAALCDGRMRSEPLFVAPRGGRLAFGTYNWWWHRDLEAAGLTRYVPHQLRHTFATVMLEEKISPKVVSSMLGHNSVGTTLELYADVTDRAIKAAIDSVGPLLSRPVADKIADESTIGPSNPGNTRAA